MDQKYRKISCSNCFRLNEPGVQFCEGCGHNLLLREEKAPHREKIQLLPSFLPSEALLKTSWPFVYVILGIGFWLGYAKLPSPLSPTDIILKPWLPISYLLAITTIFDIFLIFFSVYIFKKLHVWSPPPKIPPALFLKEVIKAFFIVLLIILASLPFMAIADFFFKEKSLFGDFSFLHYLPGNLFFMFTFLLLSFTVAPVAEEFFFRGFLYNALKSRWPTALAVIVQALFFALCHPYSVTERLMVFILGIALAIIYERRNSLIAPIFVHGVKNALPAIYMIFLFASNYHVPAANWEDALKNPEWVTTELAEGIVRQEDGMKQWQYAIDKWGSKGQHQWKKEINAFNAVCFWYPSDRKACAKAKVSVVYVYTYYLKDYKRAVVNADRLMLEYPDQKEQDALALAYKGSAYMMLKDFKDSRESFSIVVNEFRDYKEALEIAHKGLKLLDDVTQK